MKLKEKIKTKIRAVKEESRRVKPLTYAEWLNDNGLTDNGENRASYGSYVLDVDNHNKKADMRLSQFIGRGVFLLVCLVLFIVMFCNSVGATDVVDNYTYNYSTGYVVDDINGSYLSDNLYQIQRFTPESGVDFTFIYSYATDYDALSGSGIQSYIYGVKNFESFYQYLARFNYDVSDMYNHLISNYNYFEMDFYITDLIQRSIPDWLSQIEETRQLGYADGYNVGYDLGVDVGYDNGYDDGHTVGYDDGYDVGIQNGYDDGYDVGIREGYNLGYDEGVDVGETAKKSIFAIFDAPIKVLTSLLDFELFGINFLSIFKVILTIILLGAIAKFVLSIAL